MSPGELLQQVRDLKILQYIKHRPPSDSIIHSLAYSPQINSADSAESSIQTTRCLHYQWTTYKITGKITINGEQLVMLPPAEYPNNSDTEMLNSGVAVCSTVCHGHIISDVIHADTSGRASSIHDHFGT